MKSIEENYNYFLKANVNQYLGEWIAIVDESIVSHGKSAKTVYEEAIARFPEKRPLLTRIHEKTTMVL